MTRHERFQRLMAVARGEITLPRCASCGRFFMNGSEYTRKSADGKLCCRKKCESREKIARSTGEITQRASETARKTREDIRRTREKIQRTGNRITAVSARIHRVSQRIEKLYQKTLAREAFLKARKQAQK